MKQTGQYTDADTAFHALNGIAVTVTSKRDDKGAHKVHACLIAGRGTVILTPMVKQESIVLETLRLCAPDLALAYEGAIDRADAAWGALTGKPPAERRGKPDTDDSGVARGLDQVIAQIRAQGRTVPAALARSIDTRDKRPVKRITVPAPSTSTQAPAPAQPGAKPASR